MKRFNIPSIYFAACFIFILYLMWLMMKPLLGAIIFAAILAGSFQTLFDKILKKVRKRELAASLTCLIIVFVVLLPTTYLVFSLSKETVGLYSVAREAMSEKGVAEFLHQDGWIYQTIEKVSNTFQVDLSVESFKEMLFDKVKSFSSVLFQSVNGWIGNIFGFLFNFLIMILTIFAIYVEGPRLKQYLLDLSPLPNDQEQLIIDKFNQMNYVTLVCNGIFGIFQGGLAGIALALIGIKSVFLWTFLMIVLAFIPLLGISIVYVPISIYLLIVGRVGAAIFIFVFCTAIAVITENWLKPVFIGKRIKINSLFVLFTIVGGMGVFGMAGIFYGPIIGIIFLTAVDIYHNHYSHEVSLELKENE